MAVQTRGGREFDMGLFIPQNQPVKQMVEVKSWRPKTFHEIIISTLSVSRRATETTSIRLDYPFVQLSIKIYSPQA